MNWIDSTILTIIFLSTLISLIEGFTRTVLSLFAWVLSFYIALNFADKLATLLIQPISYIDIRLGLSFTILFATTLALMLWVNYLLVRSMNLAGLSLVDRLLSSPFGLMRGGVAITALVFLAGLSKLPTLAVWQQSTFIIHFQQVATILYARSPTELATQFSFKPTPVKGSSAR
jgi:membrane protein required for colicin V production